MPSGRPLRHDFPHLLDHWISEGEPSICGSVIALQCCMEV